jgi:hypothetical protein
MATNYWKVFVQWTGIVGAFLICTFSNGFATVSICATACAQDVAADSTQDQSGSTAEDQVERNPVVISVQESNPQTMEDLARAIQVMMNLDRDDQAKIYLKKLVAIPGDDVQWYQLHRKYPTSFLMDLNSRAKLLPESKLLIKKISDASRKILNDPARLQNLVKQLNDSSQVKRATALADLQVLGAPAAAAILTGLADDSRSEEHVNLASALRKIGSDSLQPLLAGMQSKSRRVRYICTDILPNFRTPQSIEMLLGAMLANQDDPLLLKKTKESLTTLLGRVPREKDARATLYQSALDYLYGRNLIVPNTSDGIYSWDWQAGALIGQSVSLAAATRIRAYRRAKDLFRFNPESNQYQRLYYLCLLDSAKVKGGIGRKLQIESAESSPAGNLEILEQVLVDAMDYKRVAAAIAAVELLAECGDASLLKSKDGRMRPLLKALTYGDRRLQHQATMTVLKLSDQETYPGSSYVTRSLVHLVGSQGRPKTIVGHLDSSQAQTMAAVLEQAGYAAEIANGSRDLFRLATNDPDIEFLLITDTLDRPDYAELIQQIRHDSRTRQIPIALLSRKKHAARGKRIANNDPLTIQMPWSTNPAFLAQQMPRLLDLNQLTRVPPIERLRFSKEAATWLEKIASDPELRKIYNLTEYQQQLGTALFAPEISGNISSVLAQVPTRVGQRALLSAVNDSGLPIENRRVAAKAFNDAIVRGGTMLTTREIRDQYDRYNASEFESTESQQVLSAVLDSIEQRSGRIQDQ